VADVPSIGMGGDPPSRRLHFGRQRRDSVVRRRVFV